MGEVNEFYLNHGSWVWMSFIDSNEDACPERFHTGLAHRASDFREPLHLRVVQDVYRRGKLQQTPAEIAERSGTQDFFGACDCLG